MSLKKHVVIVNMCDFISIQCFLLQFAEVQVLVHGKSCHWCSVFKSFYPEDPTREGTANQPCLISMFEFSVASCCMNALFDHDLLFTHCTV